MIECYLYKTNFLNCQHQSKKRGILKKRLLTNSSLNIIWLITDDDELKNNLPYALCTNAVRRGIVYILVVKARINRKN